MVADDARRLNVGGANGGANWSIAETLLAALLCVYADPSRLGGTKRTKSGESRQHPGVVEMARLLGRTEDSVVLKVMNLRTQFSGGQRGMAHGSKLDADVAQHFGLHFDDLLVAAELMVAEYPSARTVVDLTCPRTGPTAFEAERLPYDPRPSSNGNESTTVLREQAVRRGQHLFRGRVMANYDHTCAMCGLHSRLPEANSFLLLASHIQPWARSNDHERLDHRNGLALCAIHDRAFDWGFVTIDESLRVVVSDHAREHYSPEDRIDGELLKWHGHDLLRPASPRFELPAERYLAFHREKVFERRFLGQ